MLGTRRLLAPKATVRAVPVLSRCAGCTHRVTSDVEHLAAHPVPTNLLCPSLQAYIVVGRARCADSSDECRYIPALYHRLPGQRQCVVLSAAACDSAKVRARAGGEEEDGGMQQHVRA